MLGLTLLEISYHKRSESLSTEESTIPGEDLGNIDSTTWSAPASGVTTTKILLDSFKTFPADHLTLAKVYGLTRGEALLAPDVTTKLNMKMKKRAR